MDNGCGEEDLHESAAGKAVQRNSLTEARLFQEREKFGLKMFALVSLALTGPMFEGVLGSVWGLPSVSYEIY